MRCKFVAGKKISRTVADMSSPSSARLFDSIQNQRVGRVTFEPMPHTNLTSFLFLSSSLSQWLPDVYTFP